MIQNCSHTVCIHLSFWTLTQKKKTKKTHTHTHTHTHTKQPIEMHICTWRYNKNWGVHVGQEVLVLVYAFMMCKPLDLGCPDGTIMKTFSWQQLHQRWQSVGFQAIFVCFFLMIQKYISQVCFILHLNFEVGEFKNKMKCLNSIRLGKIIVKPICHLYILHLQHISNITTNSLLQVH